MSTIIESKGGDFVPHPEGQFLAVLRDVYLNNRPNPWKGSVNDKGQVDVRDEVTELVMEFLTDHEVEWEGKMAPGFVRYNPTASVADNSNLRRFLKGWFPALKDDDFKRFDADKLIGKGAYLTVAHNVSKKNGNTYANVIGAMQPPKGSVIPEIPADFIRHKDKNEPPTAKAAPVATTDEDDGMPF